MRRLVQFLSAAATTALLAGCYSVYPAMTPELGDCAFAGEEGEIVGHVFVGNSGWYLFYGLPLVSGETTGRGALPVSFFTDNVNNRTLQACLEREVRLRYGAGVKLVGVSSVNSDGVTFGVPGLSIPLVVPYVLCHRNYQICGTVVRPPDGGEGGRSRE